MIGLGAIRKRLSRVSIRWKVAVPAALIAIAATALASYCLTDRNVALVRRATIEDARSDVSYASAKVQYATFLHDAKLTKRCLAEVLDANPPVVFAEVVDTDGEVLATAGQAELADKVSFGGEAESGPRPSGAAGVSVHTARIPSARMSGYYAVSPIALVGTGNELDDPFDDTPEAATGPATLGEVRLFVSDGETRAAIAKVQSFSLLIAAVLALVVAVVSYVFASRLMRPIHGLLVGTQRVADGDLDVVLPIEQNDELGVLARSFNQMALDLKRSYDRLNEYSTDLEAKVAERTRQLANANSELGAQHAALQESNRQLSVINRISQSVSRSIHIQDVLQSAVAEVIRVADAQAGAIYVWDEAARRMSIEASSGLSDEFVERWRSIEADNELLGCCSASKESIVAADSAPQAAAALAGLRESEGLAQAWFVPLRSAGELAGMIQLAFETAVAPSPSSTETLVAVSRQVSSAVANAKLFEQTRTQAAALEAANRDMAAINQQLLATNEELRGANETITAQQASLVRAAKMASMGTLAAGIAHEINNPLAIIAGYSEALLDRISGLEISDEGPLRRLPRYLEVINSECFRCKGITQGLLTLAREEDLARYSGNVNDSIRETLALVNFHWEHDERSVVLSLDPDVPEIACDPNQLQQVFLNLALNAMDAMGPSKKLYITTRLEDGWIRAEFRDEGTGIRPDVLERIFDPFFTTKPEGTGTGLGLALCQAIIEQHEGTIEVESVLGEGTTFAIRLPVREPPSLSEAQSSVADRSAAA